MFVCNAVHTFLLIVYESVKIIIYALRAVA